MRFDSYELAGVATAAELVNALALERAFGRRIQPDLTVDAIQRILVADPTWPRIADEDVPAFVLLATRLRAVFDAVHRGDLDAAASQLNDLFGAHPAHPHLAKDDGTWRLHHHPADTAALPMATAICAEALARVIGAGAGSRLGTCDAPDCNRVFLDSSKNASRRFCSTTCQNRVKAMAFRRRHATTHAGGGNGDRRGRAVVLVEGASDKAALEALAVRLGRDLAGEGTTIVAMGGAHAIGRSLARFGPGGLDLKLAGLCDAGEEADFRRGLEQAGLGTGLGRAGMEALGFYVCEADLEDELIRALGADVVERIVRDHGDLRSLRTFQKQPAQRRRPVEAQLRRFLGTHSGRKIAYGRLLVEALEPAAVPRPLACVLAAV